jgi:hypothetical protein
MKVGKGFKECYRIGAAAMELAKRDPAFAAEFYGILNHTVTDPEERALFPELANRVPDVRLPAPTRPDLSGSA